MKICLYLLSLCCVYAQTDSVIVKRDTLSVQEENLKTVHSYDEISLTRSYGGEHRSSFVSATSILPHQVNVEFNGFKLNDHFSSVFTSTRLQKKRWAISSLSGHSFKFRSDTSAYIKPLTHFILADGDFSSTYVESTYQQSISKHSKLILGFHNFEPNAPIASAFSGNRRETQVFAEYSKEEDIYAYHLTYMFYRNVMNDYGYDILAYDQSTYFSESRVQNQLILTGRFNQFLFGFRNSVQNRDWEDITISKPYKSWIHEGHIYYKYFPHQFGIKVQSHVANSAGYTAKWNRLSLGTHYMYHSEKLRGSIEFFPFVQTDNISDESPVFNISADYTDSDVSVQINAESKMPLINQSVFVKDSSKFSVLDEYSLPIRANTALENEYILSGNFEYSYHKNHALKLYASSVLNPIEYKRSELMFLNSKSRADILISSINNLSFQVLVDMNLQFKNTFGLYQSNSFLPKFSSEVHLFSAFHLIGDCDIRLSATGRFDGKRKLLYYSRYTGMYSVSDLEKNQQFSGAISIDFIIKKAVLSFKIGNLFQPNISNVYGYTETSLGSWFSLDWTFND